MARTLNKMGISQKYGSVRKIDKNLAFDVFCSGREVIVCDARKSIDDENATHTTIGKRIFKLNNIVSTFSQFISGVFGKAPLSYFVTSHEYKKYEDGKKAYNEAVKQHLS